VSDRLRVFVVARTDEELSALRTRLARTGTFDIVGQARAADVQSGTAIVPSGVDAVVSPPEPPRPAALASAAVRPAADEPMLEQLTPRERSVLALLADGLPNREIAHQLEISEHTVKFHLASIFGKLAASTRTEAVRRGLQLGLIEI
jgi:DNA-binding NarL/FixJ family response regulator